MKLNYKWQIVYALGSTIAASLLASDAGARPHFSDCAVKMEVPAPLTVGTVWTPEFAVKRKLYFILLRVEPGNGSTWDVSCLLGDDNSSVGVQCHKEPMVEGHWVVWDATTKVAEGTFGGAKGEGEFPYERDLGEFEGEAKRKFVVEVTFSKDGGPLKDMHPRLVVRQDYDFWCGPM